MPAALRTDPVVPVHPAGLPAPVDGWFTGAPEAPAGTGPAAATSGPVTVGRPGNLSARRPHRPEQLASARRVVAEATGTDARRWHLMRQVHGARVGVVDAATPPGAELDGVDALVTRERDRPLGVFVADCVPVLIAGATAVAAVHAGRAGVVNGVVDAALDALWALGESAGARPAGMGPPWGGGGYAGRASRGHAVGAGAPAAAATTSWGTPALDLPRAVEDRLARAEVPTHRVGGCTRCTPGWFSHRADPEGGRQLGLVVRR
ncbi:MAG: laccase domain-containing protein [Nitriliruptoraceae bacterium]|nr:laccase domain-containing protein [Nitriliruptoraceae bacterium]